MRCVSILVMGLALFGVALNAEAAAAKIVKVLPHYLDLEGRHTLSPSLYERDAYQARLRKNPDLCSGLRFDVQWRAGAAKADELKMRLELRNNKEYAVQPLVIEQVIKPKGWFNHWSALPVQGDVYNKLGKIIAWRIVLMKNGQPLAVQKSFLWQD